MGEDYNELWWTKEDRKLLFLAITLKGIVIHLDSTKMIEAYDDSQPIQTSENHIFLTSPVIIGINDKEILNILNEVFGIKTLYSDWLSGFDIEIRKI